MTVLPPIDFVLTPQDRDRAAIAAIHLEAHRRRQNERDALRALDLRCLDMNKPFRQAALEQDRERQLTIPKEAAGMGGASSMKQDAVESSDSRNPVQVRERLSTSLQIENHRRCQNERDAMQAHARSHRSPIVLGVRSP